MFSDVTDVLAASMDLVLWRVDCEKPQDDMLNSLASKLTQGGFLAGLVQRNLAPPPQLNSPGLRQSWATSIIL
jgi:hypothetical protein